MLSFKLTQKISRNLSAEPEKTESRMVLPPLLLLLPDLNDQVILRSSYLDMPNFSGKPSEWNHFRELFTSALARSSSDCTNREKACLLEQSMKHLDAQAIVKHLTHTSDRYNKAMKALIEEFGSDKKVFSVLVNKTLDRAPIDFNREGFIRLRKRICMPFKAIEEQGFSNL